MVTDTGVLTKQTKCMLECIELALISNVQLQSIFREDITGIKCTGRLALLQSKTSLSFLIHFKQYRHPKRNFLTVGGIKGLKKTITEKIFIVFKFV